MTFRLCPVRHDRRMRFFSPPVRMTHETACAVVVEDVLTPEPLDVASPVRMNVALVPWRGSFSVPGKRVTKYVTGISGWRGEASA